MPSSQLCWKLGTQGGGTGRSCGTCWRWELISSCVSWECCPWKGCRAFSRKSFGVLNRAAVTLILAPHPALRLPLQDMSPPIYPIYVYLTSANGHGALTRANIVLFHDFIFSFQNYNLKIYLELELRPPFFFQIKLACLWYLVTARKIDQRKTT